jgi:hypothetical protein
VQVATTNRRPTSQGGAKVIYPRPTIPINARDGNAGKDYRRKELVEGGKQAISKESQSRTRFQS